jgi:hypothetical protein
MAMKSNDESHGLLQQAAKLELLATQQSKISWDMAKWSILRLTGCVYFVAFLGAYYQNPGLIGSHGLQPADVFFSGRLRPAYYLDPIDGFRNHPTLFWFVDLNDDNLMILYKTGLALSTLVISGVDSMVIMMALWLLYFSIVTIAASSAFYQYGWESQLLETGFLCIFLCDFLPNLGYYKGNRTPPSPIILWLFRWLSFRISIGAGLIKIRGDSCWTSKTCLYYHFETQPIPSPLSFLFHFLPKWMLAKAVDLDLFVQVYTSWMVLLPTWVPGSTTSTTISSLLLWMVRLGGFIQAGFMLNIILSGNFAFLNHLTIIPALACLDDACWPMWMRQSSSVTRHHVKGQGLFQRPKIRILLDLYLLWLIGSLSWPVVENLLQLGGKRQQMNASFGSFRLVNTYGAFGSVGQARYEPIVSISYDGQDWIELEFPCKPGNVTRRPCFCAPYHYRLDWNIWFLGFIPHKQMLRQRETWLYELIAKLLDEQISARPWLDLFDASTTKLLEDGYNQKKYPKFCRVDMFHYKMAAPLWELLPIYFSGHEVTWWNRSFEETLIVPVVFDMGHKHLMTADLPQ